LPIFGILSGASLIGWGKPVPVNPLNLKNPRKDEVWIAAGGPITNILAALVFAGIGRAVYQASGSLAVSQSSAAFWGQVMSIIYTACYLGVRLNLGLAVFNLIPLYPLDGGGVLRGFLPDRLVDKFDQFSRHSVILLLVLFATGALRFIFIPVQIVANILLPL
jgi:Zn-dependent protease